MSEFLKRTWAEINLDAIINNFTQAKNASGGAEVMAVVKADAYGHGVSFVATALEEAGARWFGVSNIEEALQLRDIGISGDILIFGFTPPELAEILIKENFSQTVYSPEYARLLTESAELCGKKLQVHIKLDTGMNRLGFRCVPGSAKETVHQITEIFAGSSFIPEGIYTHFASSDGDGDPDGSFTAAQSAAFHQITEDLRSRGLEFEFRHLSQSGGIFTRGRDSGNMVRPGIMLYGMPPDPGLQNNEIQLTPALSVKSVITMIHEIDAGETVSYGRTYKAAGGRRIATVPLGYADGFPRAVSNKAEMLIRGKRAKIAGRVCMDQLMLDITGIPEAQIGDTVTVVGRDVGDEIALTELSALAGTISYETLCLIGKRVPRKFYKNGREAGSINYITDAFKKNQRGS